MKTPKLIVSSIAALILLTGCSEAPSTPQPSEVVKEAGVRGTRICFANETKLPISVAPSDFVNQPNADHIVGKAGAVTPGSELCFAGWNSYFAPQFHLWSEQSYGNNVQDIVVSVNIDGAYNVLFFKSKNEIFFPAAILHSTELYSDKWVGFGSPGANNWPVTAAGHTFIETYRDDSEYYKEFLVTFTK